MLVYRKNNIIIFRTICPLLLSVIINYIDLYNVYVITKEKYFNAKKIIDIINHDTITDINLLNRILNTDIKDFDLLSVTILKFKNTNYLDFYLYIIENIIDNIKKIENMYFNNIKQLTTNKIDN